MRTRFESTVIASLTAFTAVAESPTLCAETISGEASNAAGLKRLSLEDLMNTEVTSVSRAASTVGESPAAVFAIRFFAGTDRKVRFEINPKATERARLKQSGAVMRLARITTDSR